MMKRFLLFLFAIAIAGVIAVIAVIRPDKKPTPDESDNVSSESPSDSDSSETPSDGLKITLDPSQFIIQDMIRTDEGESN